MQNGIQKLLEHYLVRSLLVGLVTLSLWYSTWYFASLFCYVVFVDSFAYNNRNYTKNLGVCMHYAAQGGGIFETLQFSAPKPDYY